MRKIVEVVMAINPIDKKDDPNYYIAEIKLNGERMAFAAHLSGTTVKAVIDYDPEKDTIEGVVYLKPGGE